MKYFILTVSQFIFIFFWLDFLNAQETILPQLPFIPERGVVLKNGFGNDLVGVSGMSRCGEYLYLISERMPQYLYFGKFNEMCKRAMGVMKISTAQMDSIPIHYNNGLEIPALGEGRGFEAVEFCLLPSGTEVFFSYEADDNDLLYKGNLKYENGQPKSVEVIQKYHLPENPEGAVHNAGWEAIAYDPSTGNLTGVHENRLSLNKMAFEVNSKNIPLTFVSNLPPVQIEYRVTDLTCISSGKFVASVYIWKETYQNLKGEEILAEVPQFRLVEISRKVDQKKGVSLTPVILKTFLEEDDKYGEDYLNFEGITAVNGKGLPNGILIINDNDPPYFKFGNKHTPPSILRFLLNSECGISEQ